MRYHVAILAEAEGELEDAYRYIREDSPSRAKRWRTKVRARARTLRRFPQRCPVAPESEALGVEVRHLVVGSYRLIFAIAGDTVTVLHVRHAARRLVTEEEGGS